MNKHDQLQTKRGKEALYRIYNDVRFQTDKTPYNPRFAGSLKRVKLYLRGDYSFWIKPGESRIGCGFTCTNPQDLLLSRQDIDVNYTVWRKQPKSKKVISVIGEMQGDQVKKTPKAFINDHQAIDPLRCKQYWFEKSFTDKEVLSPDFDKRVNDAYKAIQPFFNYMTDKLTTDSNGISII